jgi:hypothetical protein
MEPNQATLFRVRIDTRIATPDCVVADPDLAAVVDAWAALSEAIKAAHCLTVTVVLSLRLAE